MFCQPPILCCTHCLYSYSYFTCTYNYFYYFLYFDNSVVSNLQAAVFFAYLSALSTRFASIVLVFYFRFYFWDDTSLFKEICCTCFDLCLSSLSYCVTLISLKCKLSFKVSCYIKHCSNTLVFLTM